MVVAIKAQLADDRVPVREVGYPCEYARRAHSCAQGYSPVLTGALTEALAGALAGVRTHTGAQGRRVRAQVAVQSAMLLALAGLRGDVGFAPAVLDEFMPPLLIVASDSSSVRPSARLRRPGSVDRPGEDRRVHVGSLDYPEYPLYPFRSRHTTQRNATRNFRCGDWRAAGRAAARVRTRAPRLELGGRAWAVRTNPIPNPNALNRNRLIRSPLIPESLVLNPLKP